MSAPPPLPAVGRSTFDRCPRAALTPLSACYSTYLCCCPRSCFAFAVAARRHRWCCCVAVVVSAVSLFAVLACASAHRVSVSASQYVRVDVPQSHSAPRALFRAASAGPWVPGHVVRPAGGSVRYSLGARPTSRACLVRQNQQRHGRPPHGAPLPRPGPATTPGRSMPVLIGHTARPVRRIFPSWQLLPAQLVVW